MSRGASVHLGQGFLALLLVLAAPAPPAVAQADVKGQWSTLNYSMTINPIHVVLMHDGKILVIDRFRKLSILAIGLPVGSAL